MDSVQKGLRAGAIEKDTYDRLVCSVCDEQLKTRAAPEEVYSLRVCPECGETWRQLG